MRQPSLALLLLAVVGFTSCRKEESPKPDRDHAAALDNSRAEFFFHDALRQSDAAAKGGTVPCAVSVTIDLQASPHTMLVDFGEVNCTGPDGLRRRGRLFVTFTGPYGAVGTVITITPQDYFVNDHQLQGTKVVTNAGPNAQGQTYFTVSVNGTVTAPDNSWTSTHNANRIRTWIAGEGTMDPFDDVYLITGEGSGVNRNGLAYTSAITTPLRVEIGCPWIVSGVQTVTPSGRPTWSIDFGSGACDGNFTVSVNGWSVAINWG